MPPGARPFAIRYHGPGQPLTVEDTMDPGVSTAGKMAVDDFQSIAERLKQIRAAEDSN